ncbi:hypothetical protein [Sulfitobacter pontiacus]|uniref:competence protein CoiA family protein n=1 Tax=Sulfitobacter pontiacus TaxID=60137 RepID=UPI0031599695
MAGKPKRIVEAAIIDGIGIVTASDLLAMTEDRWGMLRDRITDARGGAEGLSARCMACNSSVYIRSARRGGVPQPLFQHYSDSDPNCPWYNGKNSDPDKVRASQYQGRQESRFHRLMCEQIAELVQLDPRYIGHTIAEYLAPTDSQHGRFPDIYVVWEDFGPFAVEFQMSGTFQTEVSARCKHYEREGIPLIWVLFGLDTASSLPQSFRDVIRRHRGNAFVVDVPAIEASREQGTFVLNCHVSEGADLTGPELVRFDELSFPRSKLPYFRDQLVGPRLWDIEQLRRPWFLALNDWERYSPLNGLDRDASVLVAAAFSIVAHANGREENYLKTRQNLVAMLNSQLNEGPSGRGGVISQYADLLEHLLRNTAMHSLLDTAVGQHLRRATAEQKDESSPEWRLLRKLLPEALDPLLRDELLYLDALPSWALVDCDTMN